MQAKRRVRLKRAAQISLNNVSPDSDDAPDHLDVLAFNCLLKSRMNAAADHD
jgi:hypothetical protein